MTHDELHTVTTADTGYSGKPLHAKLGFKPGMRIAILGAPENYWALLGLPADAFSLAPLRTGRKPGAALQAIHLFEMRQAALAATLPRAMAAIEPNGMIWVSWPKKSAGVATDITEDVIRAICLPMGLVDVKVCAVDATWSGLKLVIRVSERG